MDVPHEGRLVGRGGEEDGAVAPVAVGQGHVARRHVVRQQRGVRKSALEMCMLDGRGRKGTQSGRIKSISCQFCLVLAPT